MAYWCSGRGDAVLTVHGLSASHLSWLPFADRLGGTFTACTYDRRGRGESGDQLPYAFERESEDLVAIATALGPAAVLGHSLGGAFALEAAMIADAVSALILFEGWPSPGSEMPEEMLAEMERLVSTGQLEDAFNYGDSPEDVELARQLPDYAERVAAAHASAREIRGWDRYWFEHPVDDERWRALDKPVLLLLGEEHQEITEPPAELLAQQMPRATIRVLKGQGHGAYREAPDLLAREVREWLSSI